MKFSAGSQLGFRAAIATLLAILISPYLHFSHGFWAVLTVIALMASSWGETISRAWQRFGMTVLGCSVGTLLIMVLGVLHWFSLLIGFIATFFIIFYIATSYRRAMFFTGILVVMIFDIIGKWSVGLLIERIAETALGCVIVVLVTGLFLPQYERKKTQNQFVGVFELTAQVAHELLAQSKIGKLTQKKSFQMLNPLNEEFLNLQLSLQHAQYESFFIRGWRKNTMNLVRELGIVTHYIGSLSESLPRLKACAVSDVLKYPLGRYRTHIAKRFQEVIDSLERKRVRPLAEWKGHNTPALKQKLKKLRASKRYQANDFLYVSAVIYYATRLDTELKHIVEQLQSQLSGKKES